MHVLVMIASFKSLHFLLGLFVSLKLLALAQEENHFIYNGFTGADLLLSGIAKIHPNGLLELTNTSKRQIGRAFFPFPFQFNTSLFNNSRLPEMPLDGASIGLMPVSHEGPGDFNLSLHRSNDFSAPSFSSTDSILSRGR
ncbi:hypothetical protein D5086_017759 [Populus alba]|uniref:Uncharacterized protein n=1 Tax=Populus alba TaxID=43335 RepID=A0ACC4BP69_POPAL